MIHYREYIENDSFIPQLVTLGKKSLSDNIICFDIETCNYFVYDNQVYSINDIIKKYNADVKKIEDFFTQAEAGACPFIWQVCVDGVTVYGRELKEFKRFFNYLDKKMCKHKWHLWIHNLAFEYQFLQEIFKFKNKFFTEARKPLYVKYKHCLFRCSYRLTNLSLAKWGKNLGIEKLTGALDYHDMYSPKSKLSQDNLAYCETDVYIMYKGILQYKDMYKHIEYIPTTQTGIPRGDIKKLNQKEKKFLKQCAKMQPRTPDEWKVQHCTFNGGLTLCNPANAGKVLKNVGGFDKKSAYPFQMLQKFPCTVFEKSTAQPVWTDGNHHMCLCEFVNLNAKYDITPLSSSKRIMQKGVVYSIDYRGTTKERLQGISRNNGKIMHADRFALYITEKDKELIDLYYKYDKVIVHDHYIALSDYMPRHVIEYMLKRFEQKTLLTGIDEVMRLREKEKINALYGLSATALIHDDITESDTFEYIKTRKTDTQIMEELQKLHSQVYRNVLPYSYGLYITSYQRLELMKTALLFADGTGKNALHKLCYFDTDSEKGFFTDADREKIARLNDQIIEWTRERLAEQDIPFEMSCPMNKKGYREHLGIWEEDIASPNKQYYEFKCLRAKCYAYKLTADDHTHITIAGVPKTASNVLQSVDDLKEGLEFDLFNSRKSLLTYRDGDNPQVKLPDGYKVKNTCSINIRPTSYKLTFDTEYRDLIKMYLSQKYH